MFLQPFHSKSGAMNHPRYVSEKFDALLDEAAKIADLDLRSELLRQAEAQLLADHPMAPLYVYSTKNLVSPRIRGWVDNAKSIHPARYLSME